MYYIGLDVGKTSSPVCIVTEDGELIERRIKTARGQFSKLLGQHLQARILLEASTESEWIARHLEQMGHEVVVADPNFALMYATRSKRIKTDRRDARALCEACRVGAYRRVHRTSEKQRHIRAQLSVREALVTTRAKYSTLTKAVISREGWRVQSGSSQTFVERLQRVPLSAELAQEIAPLVTLLAALNEQIAEADRKLEEIVETDERVRRLTSVPGVGKVTAMDFAAAIDEVERFASAKQVRSYFGLVPRESSSGERRRRGHISKAGNRRIRTLLVEVAWGIICRKESAANAALRQWALCVAARRGRRIAAVALARKLAGILFAMWRDGTEYSAKRAHPAQGETALAA